MKVWHLSSVSQIGQIIFHSYLPTEVSSSAYLAKTAAEKSEIIWSKVMVDTLSASTVYVYGAR